MLEDTFESMEDGEEMEEEAEEEVDRILFEITAGGDIFPEREKILYWSSVHIVKYLKVLKSLLWLYLFH